MLMVSCASDPWTAPLPYWIWTWDDCPVVVVGCWSVDESEGLNVGTPLQLVHVDDASQRSDEPVSSTTLKVWPGVPTVMAPM